MAWRNAHIYFRLLSVSGVIAFLGLIDVARRFQTRDPWLLHGSEFTLIYASK
jgi:hypothetical protein